MNLTYDKLSNEDQLEQLKTTQGWQIVEGTLTKEFKNKSYPNGVLFANAVARQAEELNHHPDILITYHAVTISMVTHDADGGLTAYDFELARRIDKLDQ